MAAPPGSPVFDDILAANRRYAASFGLAGLDPDAARGLAVLTCIDSRIEPLAMLGLVPGDAKILRNAGGRVTDDVLRSLVLAVAFMGVRRFCLVQHTRCRLHGVTSGALADAVEERLGHRPARDFLPIADHLQVLHTDVELIGGCPELPRDLDVAGFLYDVDTGLLTRMV